MDQWTPQEIGQFIKEAGWSTSALVLLIYAIKNGWLNAIKDAILAVKSSVQSNTETNKKLEQSIKALETTAVNSGTHHNRTHQLIETSDKNNRELHDTSHNYFKQILRHLEALAANDPKYQHVVPKIREIDSDTR